MNHELRTKKRILIVNPFGIGDVIFTMPLLKALKRNFPNSYLGYLCNIRTAPIISSQADIDKVFIYEKDEYRQLWKVSRRRCIRQLLSLLKEVKSESFDMVFDLSLAQEYGFFLCLAGIRERIGYNYRKRGIFLTQKIALPNGYSGKHMVDYYLGLLDLVGLKEADPDISISISGKARQSAKDILRSHGISDNEPFACIAPGAGASWGATSFRKQWPREKFKVVTEFLLKNLGLKTLLLGSGADTLICDYIKSEQDGCINLCGKTDLMSFAAIVSMGELLIANDGGPLHIAVAQDTKSVSIFGPVDDLVYGPYGSGKDHIVVKNNNLDCRPCYKNFKLPECDSLKCVEDISVDTVIEAIKGLSPGRGK